MWLSVAAFEDIADFIIQENNYISFMSNTGKMVGKGPTQFAKRMKERRAQRKYVESACDAILTTDLWGEVEKHTDPDALFVPSNAAKHRVPKKFSTKNPLLLSQTKMILILILELMMMMIVMLTLNQTIVFHHVQNLLFQFAKYFLHENDEGKI